MLWGVISLIPYPATKIIGGLLQIPDIYYDAKNVYDNPENKTNWAHLGLDGLSFIPGFTIMTADDVLKIPGTIDDAYNAITNRDAIDDVRKKLSSTPENKHSIKDENKNRQ